MLNRTLAASVLPVAAILWVAIAPGRPETTRKRAHFINAAPRSKIPYVSNNSSGGRKYFPQPMCGGVAIFDFDNDGRLRGCQ